MQAVIKDPLTQQHQQMDGLLKEAAQQVAYHCSEQGRVLDGLRERYAELANALFLGLSCLSQHTAAVSAALQGAASAAAADRAVIRSLQRQLTDKTAEAEDLRSELGTSQAKLEQIEAESAEELKQSLQESSRMKQQLWQCKEELEVARAAADAAADAARAELEAQATAAEQAQHDMQQRLGFLNAQLMALREQQVVAPDTAHAAVQTDAVEAPPLPAAEPSAAPSSEPSSESSVEEEEGPVRKRRKKALDLLAYARRGQPRSKLWLVKVIGQLYADKAVADAVADRAGQQRSAMQDFIFTWHLNRYGLKHLAVEALSDLLASACHHAHSCQPALWFARFCSLAKAIKQPAGSRAEQPRRSSSSSSGNENSPSQDEGAAADAADSTSAPSAAAAADVDVELLLSSPAALDFYLFCCCQLAYPNSVLALFPEGEDAQPLVRSSLVMEGLKAVFR
ncbi:hypothetical protein OEZ85_000631 [Tetradesmus obliquus]|uniref:Uncharacterized protein n=1 Tax=Tetradesmus obliquus TaxID=3088 RepID=A0ABY8UJJ2_TETOB|nr:hypothetical protein OEZ85_000631 [Tetradesmus obliquus]